MMKLLSETDPFLKYKQELTLEHPSTFTDIIKEMFIIMRTNNGIGLAANQVGLKLNLFVMDIDEKEYVIFNPKIIEQDATRIVKTEGCLSFPKLKLDVARPIKIIVEYTDLAGTVIQETLSGLAARCFLHEADHLRGITFTQKVPKRELLRARINRTKS